MKLTKLTSLALPALAVAMLALTALPAETWKAPTNDAVYKGFDPNLVYTSGEVRLSPDLVNASASGASPATVNLATTLRRSLVASLDVTVLANDGLQPMRVGLWSPWTASGYFVLFGRAPQNTVTVMRIVDGSPGPTLLGGSVTPTPIGTYTLGTPYRVSFLVDRQAGRIDAAVTGPGLEAKSQITNSELPAIFGNVQLSLSASAVGDSGASGFTLRNFTLTLPHERSWASKVDDPVARILLVALAALGIVALAVALVSNRRRLTASFPRPRGRWNGLAIGSAIVFLAGNLLLFPLGGHPFDFANEQLYAYVAAAYGPSQLYFLPDVVSLARVWNGVPWIQVAFPYEPGVAYLFAGVGSLGALLVGGTGTLAADSAQLGYLVKGVNVLFGFADGVLIYRILRKLNVSEKWSRIGAALFLFNPAVWFSMSVWGQTHVVSIFFVLTAILFAQRRNPTWAWLALAVACLTRPQMVVFGLLLGVAFIRWFTWRETVTALSWTTVASFVGMTPLTLATSPSLPVDVLINNLRVQEGGGNQALLTTVSQDAYSIWPLVTYLFHGTSGLGRAFTPSSAALIGSVSYQLASQILIAVALLLVVGALLLRQRSAIQSGGYIPLVAIGVTSFLMLLTGVVATHFLLALPLLLLCRRWMDPIAYCYVAAVWSISTFVPMFGDMGVATAAATHGYSLLAPANNPITHFFVNLYAWDRFITAAILANVCALIWLIVLTVRSPIRVSSPA